MTPIHCKHCGERIFWADSLSPSAGGFWYHETGPKHHIPEPPDTDFPDWYHPRPETPRYEQVRNAMKVLADPDIPYEHEKDNHNCGECWQCIMGTILFADLLRKQIRKQQGLPT